MSLTVESSEVQQFLKVWHENGRAEFQRFTPGLDYDSYYPKTAKNRNKYIALDRGTSGCFLVDKLTHSVFSIKGYGQKGRYIGTIESLISSYEIANATHRNIHPTKPNVIEMPIKAKPIVPAMRTPKVGDLIYWEGDNANIGREGIVVRVYDSMFDVEWREIERLGNDGEELFKKESRMLPLCMIDNRRWWYSEDRENARRESIARFIAMSRQPITSAVQ